MIGDSASNGNALAVLAVVSLVGAGLGVIAGLIRWHFLPVFDPNSGAEVIPLPQVCDCDDCYAWYGGKSNDRVGRKWWQP